MVRVNMDVIDGEAASSPYETTVQKELLCELYGGIVVYFDMQCILFATDVIF